MNSDFPCPNCGGTMYGDGYTGVVHCENAGIDSDPGPYEPDAGPIYCKGTMDE